MKNVLNFYEKIENDIKNRILSGELKPLQQIEGENTLKEMYKVSRMTVRQALNNLVNSGYLYRHKGKGTFVCNTKIEKQLRGLIGFTQTMNLYNKTVRNEIIKFSLINPPEQVAVNLMLEDDDKVFEVHRLRYGNEEPILYEKLYISYKQFKNISVQDFENSFYSYLAEKNMKIGFGSQKIDSIKCPKDLIPYFKCDGNEPFLCVKFIGYLDDGRPVEYTESFYLGSKYSFVQTIK